MINSLVQPTRKHSRLTVNHKEEKMDFAGLLRQGTVSADELVETLQEYAKQGASIDADVVIGLFNRLGSFDLQTSIKIIKAAVSGLIRVGSHLEAVEYWRILHWMEIMHGPVNVERWLTERLFTGPGLN